MVSAILAKGANFEGVKVEGGCAKMRNEDEIKFFREFFPKKKRLVEKSSVFAVDASTESDKNGAGEVLGWSFAVKIAL